MSRQQNKNTMPHIPHPSQEVAAHATVEAAHQQETSRRRQVVAGVAGAAAIVIAAKTGMPADHGKALAGAAEHGPDLGMALGPFAALAKLNLGKRMKEAKNALQARGLGIGKLVVGALGKRAENNAEKLVDGKRVLNTPVDSTRSAVKNAVIKTKRTKAVLSRNRHEKQVASLTSGEFPRSDRKLRREERKAAAKSAKASAEAKETRYERQMRRKIGKQIFEGTGGGSSETARTSKQRAFANELQGKKDEAAHLASLVEGERGRTTDENDKSYVIQETGKGAELDIHSDEHGLYLNGAYDIKNGVAGRTEKIRIDTSGVDGDHISYHDLPKLSKKKGEERYILAPDGFIYSLRASKSGTKLELVQEEEYTLRDGKGVVVREKNERDDNFVHNGRNTPSYGDGDKAYFQLKGTHKRMITFNADGHPVIEESDKHDFKPILRLAADNSDQAFIISPDTGQRVELSVHKRNGTAMETYNDGGVIKQREVGFADLPHDAQLDGKPIFLQSEKQDKLGNKSNYVYVQAGSRVRLIPNFYRKDGSVWIDDRGLLLTDDWHSKERRKERRANMHVSKAEMEAEDKRFHLWEHRKHEADHLFAELSAIARGKDAMSQDMKADALMLETVARAEHKKAVQIGKERRMNRRRVIRTHRQGAADQARIARAMDIGLSRARERRIDKYEDVVEGAALRGNRIERRQDLLRGVSPADYRKGVRRRAARKIIRDTRKADRDTRRRP